MKHRKNPYMAYERHKQESAPSAQEAGEKLEYIPEDNEHAGFTAAEEAAPGSCQEECEPEKDTALEEAEADSATLQALLKEERLRMLAEMDNFRKRMQREKEEQIRFAAEAVLSDLLPSLDNFELALSYGKDNEACREMLQGLEMTHKLLLDALAAHGLERVGKVGEEFNPEIHEALTSQSCPDLPPGHVAQLFQPGYRLNQRLLRPAKVVVSS